MLYPILRTIGYILQCYSSTESFLTQCLFDAAHDASQSKDVDIIKLLPVQYYTFYNGLIQQDCSECLMVLIDVIHKGSMPYPGSNNNFTGFL